MGTHVCLQTWLNFAQSSISLSQTMGFFNEIISWAFLCISSGANKAHNTAIFFLGFAGLLLKSKVFFGLFNMNDKHKNGDSLDITFVLPIGLILAKHASVVNIIQKLGLFLKTRLCSTSVQKVGLFLKTPSVASSTVSERVSSPQWMLGSV